MFKLNERFGWGVKKEALIKKIGAQNWTTSEQTYSISLTKISGQVFTKTVLTTEGNTECTSWIRRWI